MSISTRFSVSVFAGLEGTYVGNGFTLEIATFLENMIMIIRRMGIDGDTT